MIGRSLRSSAAALAGVAMIAASPFGITPCSGVRPGAPLVTEGAICTFNFIFKGSDGATYAGTAGHCFDDTIEETRTWPTGVGPIAGVPTGQSDVNLITEGTAPVGRWVFKAFGGDWAEYNDFGLIQIDTSAKVVTSMCHFGGPIGINKDLTTEPEVVHHYGNGRGFREGPRARTALAPLGLVNNRHVFAYGAASPGDSGGAVTDDAGRAVGLLVAVGALFDGIPPSNEKDVGVLEILRLSRQLKIAERELGLSLTLMEGKVTEE